MNHQQSWRLSAHEPKTDPEGILGCEVQSSVVWFVGSSFMIGCDCWRLFRTLFHKDFLCVIMTTSGHRLPSIHCNRLLFVHHCGIHRVPLKIESRIVSGRIYTDVVRLQMGLLLCRGMANDLCMGLRHDRFVWPWRCGIAPGNRSGGMR